MSLEVRLDQWLVLAGFAVSRSKAQELIKAGGVEICLEGRWQKAQKASLVVPKNLERSLIRLHLVPETQWVSRSGEKLRSALLRLQQGSWAGQLFSSQPVCLDLGQSTGGFTEVLLGFGASQVLGIDVGHGQLHPKLKSDPKVICLEGLHIKDMPFEPAFIRHCPSEGFDLITADLSFTSLKPYLKTISKLGKHFVFLIKPQFEVGPEFLTKHYLVKEDYPLLSLQKSFCQEFQSAGLDLRDWFPAPISGKEGNQEYIAILTRASAP